MELQKIMQLDEKYYMNTFGKRLPVCFVSGKGIELTSSDGTVYQDFLGGIAVSVLGHSHPKLCAALHQQVDRLLHTSNYYYIEPQARLAELVCKHSCADKVFFANSGAEANEGAIKLAKIYFYKKGQDRYEIISLKKSFHGRTLATVAATGQEKFQKPYRPLTPGFIQVEPNSIEAVKAAITPKTAAIMVEPIQGESGVHPMSRQYLEELRDLCNSEGILLIFDEVQTGMGRTGYYFAHQYYGVEPDIFTSAKALGGGVPIGAVCAKDFAAKSFAPGDHGSTFGGNPLATAAGVAVFEAIEEDHLLENAQKMSAYFMNQLSGIQKKHPEIVDLRNAGLLIGIELTPETAKPTYLKLFEKHYLVSLCGNTLRLAPPLIVSEKDIDGFIKALDEVL